MSNEKNSVVCEIKKAQSELSDLLDTEQGFLKEYSLSMIVYNAACF
jgi:hypothetical protein